MFWTSRRRVAGMMFGVRVFKLVPFSSGSMNMSRYSILCYVVPPIVGVFEPENVIVYYEVVMECLSLRRKERPVRRSLVDLYGTCQPSVTTPTCNLLLYRSGPPSNLVGRFRLSLDYRCSQKLP